MNGWSFCKERRRGQKLLRKWSRSAPSLRTGNVEICYHYSTVVVLIPLSLGQAWCTSGQETNVALSCVQYAMHVLRNESLHFEAPGCKPAGQLSVACSQSAVMCMAVHIPPSACHLQRRPSKEGGKRCCPTPKTHVGLEPMTSAPYPPGFYPVS